MITIYTLLITTCSACSQPNTAGNTTGYTALTASATIPGTAAATPFNTAATFPAVTPTATAVPIITPTATAIPTITSTTTATPKPSPTSVKPSPTQPPVTDIAKLPAYKQEARPYSDNVLKVPQVHYVPEMNDGEAKALYYRIADYKGKEQRAFAFMAIPSTASKDNPVPAIVLVHGGGGTADAKWAKYWLDKGYAVISFDWNGKTPVKNANGTYLPNADNPYALVKFPGNIDYQKRLDQQWMYHTVSSTMIATTLIASQPGVDHNKVGIMGLSWGGLITSIVIGLDNRYAFAIPMYGCGYLNESLANFKNVYNNSAIVKLWEPSLNFSNVACPVLWLSSDHDEHFSVDALSKSYLATKNSVAYIDHDFVHGHMWTHPVMFTFADSIVKGGTPLPDIVTEPSGLNPVLKYNASKPITKAICYYRTSPLGYSGTTLVGSWEKMNCTIDAAKKEVSCTLPSGTCVYYIIIYDDRVGYDSIFNRNVNMGASSQLVVIK